MRGSFQLRDLFFVLLLSFTISLKHVFADPTACTTETCKDVPNTFCNLGNCLCLSAYKSRDGQCVSKGRKIRCLGPEPLFPSVFAPIFSILIVFYLKLYLINIGIDFHVTLTLALINWPSSWYLKLCHWNFYHLYDLHAYFNLVWAWPTDLFCFDI